MNYGTIKEYDIADGPGVRVSLFVSGCRHHCKGCFNEETWNFNYGEPFTDEVKDRILKLLEPVYIQGFSLLGGEPMEYVNQQGLLPLARKFKAAYPDKTIWCYTGYTFETDILERMCNQWEYTKEFLSLIDVLVDGEFVAELKNLNLRFRGSSNQRIIDLNATRRAGKTVLCAEYIQARRGSLDRGRGGNG